MSHSVSGVRGVEYSALRASGVIIIVSLSSSLSSLLSSCLGYPYRYSSMRKFSRRSAWYAWWFTAEILESVSDKLEMEYT